MFLSSTGLTALPCREYAIVRQYNTLLPLFSSTCTETEWGIHLFKKFPRAGLECTEVLKLLPGQTVYLLQLLSEIRIHRLLESVD